MTDSVDRDALERAIEIASRDPKRAEQIKSMLEGDQWSKPRPWEEVAKFAADLCQRKALDLKPWETAPCYSGDPRAAKLANKLLSSGLSVFEPDPLTALAAAKKRRGVA
jgi:uncharacterized metal-binding protein